MAHDIPGYGKAFKSNVRKHYPALISLGGFGEVLPRKENRVTLDPNVKDAWGVPVLRFDYVFRDNELKMAKDMADSVEEMLRAAKAEDIEIVREPLPPGWSIHEIGTARMGDDPRTSVTDRFCRCTTRRTSTSPTPRRSSAAARRTRPGRFSRWRGGRWTFLKERLRAGDV
jgi:choline dehydrogenase-like flavoprotein